MRLVVTGGAGFIGGNLCRALLRSGHDVVAFDDLSTGHVENLDGVDVELVKGTVLDAEALDEVLLGSDAVVHLAALSSVSRSVDDPVPSHHANVTGTLEVLEAVRRAGGPHLVLASSSSVYGSNPAIVRSEALQPMPNSPYAASKLAAESYALAHANVYGLDVLACRFFNVFGPGQRAGHAYTAVVPAFLDAALQGRPLPVDGDGRQSRDFTFVGALCDVLVDAVERRVTHAGPVNLAFGSRTSLLDLAAGLARIVGQPLALEHRPPRIGDFRHSQADTTRFRTLFPDARPIELDDGLRTTLDWFQS